MIFITGATSFVGRNLLDELERRRIRSTCLIRKEEDKKLFNHLKLVKLIIGNLDSKEEIEKYLDEDTTLIHLANITKENDPNIYLTNVEGTRRIIYLAEQKKIKNFIYLSSANILKKNKNLYDSSKFLCEVILKKSRLNYTIIRPSIIYGKYDNKNIIKHIEDLKKIKFKVFMERGQEIQAVYVKDVVSLIIKNLEWKKNKTILITTPPINKREYIKTIVKIEGLNLRYVIIPYLKKMNGETVAFSPQELEKELGHKPYLFKEGLLDYHNENFNIKCPNK